MKYFVKYIIAINLILLIISCQSVVRFSSDSKRTAVPSVKSSVKNSSASESELTKDKEYLEKYKTIKPIKLNIIKEAESWLGTPYQFGGTTKAGADCSGFVQSVFGFCGVSLPRTAQQQYNYTIHINSDELEPGDLIFFGHSGNISHVGIFGGNGYMFHSSSSSGVVRQELSQYLGYQNLEGFGRPSFK